MKFKLIMIILLVAFSLILTVEAKDKKAEEPKSYDLAEVEILKLENFNLKAKDLQNQFSNLRRNLNTALNRINTDRQEVWREIEARLGVEPNSYEIVGDKVVMDEVEEKPKEKKK